MSTAKKAEHSDTARLRWVAENLYEVHSLAAPEGKERVEIEWALDDDGNERGITRRVGVDFLDAFRKTIDAAMREQKEAK